MASLARVFCIALSVPALHAAQTETHVVDTSGAPGTDFAELAAAVAAAGNGDVIFVRRYDIPSFQPPIVLAGKGLTIVGEAGPNPPRIPALSVTGLAADDFFLLQGVQPNRSFEGSGTSWLNEGVIWFERCLLSFDGLPGAHDCAAAVLVGTDVLQGPLGGAPSFQARNSRVFLHGSRVFSVDGGFALEASNSVLELHGSQLIGMDATEPGIAFCEGANGGSALSLTRSLARRLDTTLVAGAGFVGDDQCGPGRDGVELRSEPSSSLIDLQGSATSYALQSPVREDESIQATLTGTPGDQVWLLASRTPGHGFGTVGLQDSLVLGAPWQVVARARLPASGSLSVQLPAPQLAGGEESRVYFSQAVVRSATTGRFVVSTASALVVLDEGL